MCVCNLQNMAKLSTDTVTPKKLKSMSENVLQLITTTMPHMDSVSVINCTHTHTHTRAHTHTHTLLYMYLLIRSYGQVY